MTILSGTQALSLEVSRSQMLVRWKLQLEMPSTVIYVHPLVSFSISKKVLVGRNILVYVLQVPTHLFFFFVRMKEWSSPLPETYLIFTTAFSKYS